MGVDLNREIKLGDLLRRKAKEPQVDDAQDAEPKKPKEERPRRALFARSPKEPKAPRGPQSPKAAREKDAVAARSGPALPQIPLMRAFNLLPKEEPREAGARLGLAQVLVALLGLVVVAGLGSAYLLMSARATDKQAKVDELRVQLADLDVPSEAPEEETDASLVTEGQARTTALATALGGRIAWDRVLREVSLVVPEDVWIEQITSGGQGAAAVTTAAPAAAGEPPAGGTAFTVKGGAESQEAVARYLARLAVIPELSGVQLQVSERQLRETSAVYSYTIFATVSPGGATS